MPRITVPPNRDERSYAWELAGETGVRAEAFSDAVHASLALPLREFEAARMRIAQINECRVCLAYRAQRDSPLLENSLEPTISEDFYEAIRYWRTADLTPRERLAAEFANRFATDHGSFETDEALWAELHEHFTDKELVHLTLIVGSCVALGRFARVLDIDGGCTSPG